MYFRRLAKLRTLSVILSIGLSACAPWSSNRTAGTVRPPVADSRDPPAALAQDVVLHALTLAGTPYRFGGNRPDQGMDCSALVRWVWLETAGVDLPRTSAQQARMGVAVSPDALKPGDLVFFNTLSRPHSHVGIYMGNLQFVHAPATGATVRVDRLDTRYWATRFEVARRIAVSDSAGNTGSIHGASRGANSGQDGRFSPAPRRS